MNTQKKTFLFLLILVSQIILCLGFDKLQWDEAVYVMNAKHFAGQKIYFEDIRPPLHPLMYSVFIRLGLGDQTCLYIGLVSAIILYLTYLLAEDLFGPETGLYSLMFLASNPLYMYWSTRFFSSVPATMFILLSVISVRRYMKTDKTTHYFTAFISCSLAFLTRHPLGLSLLIAYFLLFFKKHGFDIASFLSTPKTHLGFLIFLTPVIPWLIYLNRFRGPYITFKMAVHWPSQVSSDFLLYFKSIPLVFGLQIFLVAYAFWLYLKKPRPLDELTYPLLPFLVLAGFFQVFSQKQLRFLVPLIPFASILVVQPVLQVVQSRGKKMIILFFIVSAAAGIYASNCIDSKQCSQKGFELAGKTIQSLGGGNILSNHWPYAAYYSSQHSRSMPAKELFDKTISEFGAQYVLTTGSGGWPPYANNQSFFTNRGYALVFSHNGTCYDTYLYEIV
ncbi:MAG: hypothetical protein GF334_03575 [Candidatus Altiarchaeales archaeon]|nr:hypothetical protein [Candidatus Altiarchaeales archaeon]